MLSAYKTNQLDRSARQIGQAGLLDRPAGRADMQKRMTHASWGHGNLLTIVEISTTNPPKGLFLTKTRPVLSLL